MLRRLVLASPFVLLAFVVAGCGLSQRDVENQIRDEMKKQMKVDIASFDIKKQPDGSFSGTATAQTGQVYDVASKITGTKFEWQAIPGQAMMEKDIREGIEKKFDRKVKTLQLTKSSPGNFNGKAEVDTGEKLDVKVFMDGGQVKWEATVVAP